MNWLSLFKKTKNISAEETREFISSSTIGEYQLLDVRTPKEYAKEHIPGAILIPVKELPDRIDELNPELQTIVY